MIAPARPSGPLRQLHSIVVRFANHVDPILLGAVFVGLNVSWLLTLAAFGSHFERVAGLPLLDLQNDLRPGRIITPTQVLEQIAAYGPEARSLYWSFFVLDNLAPPLVFGSFALLWARLLRADPARPARWLLGSLVLLLPLGVGAFDWLENLAYVTAIHAEPGPGATAAVYAGLTFKWLKAACLLPTFPLTLWLLARRAFLSLRAAAASGRGRPLGAQ